MRVDDFEVREGLYYSKDYLWVKSEKGRVRVGLTDYAQKMLRHIVYIDMPKIDAEVKQAEVCGSVESIKAVADLISPLDGKVCESNSVLESNAGLINEEPYGKGWLFIIEPSNLDADLKNLMDFNKALEWHKELAAKK